ncbi:short-chain dehydrogenase [Xylogone sp. PMI_703]|nr:short-chain dehydrogenase [Xylogone sp. PMI_703]
MSLQGRVIAITGGASGIGLATAKILSSRGATVCIADYNPTTLAETQKYFDALNVPFMITLVNVAKRSDRYGRLDGAANVAGVIGPHHGIHRVMDIEDDEWDRLIAINLTGLMYCLRAELRNIADSGSIVNVSSVQGVMGFPYYGAYSATKHGVIGLTRAAAKEMGDRNIRVNAVGPGAIQTPMLDQAAERNSTEKESGEAASAIKRVGTPEEVGNVIAFLLGPESSFVTGAIYMADGGRAC